MNETQRARLLSALEIMLRINAGSTPEEHAVFLTDAPIRQRALELIGVSGVDGIQVEHVERVIDVAAVELLADVVSAIYDAQSVGELCRRLEVTRELLTRARRLELSVWGDSDWRAVVDDSALPSFDFELTFRETFLAYSWGLDRGKRCILCFLEDGMQTVDVHGQWVEGPKWYLHRLDAKDLL